MGSGAADDQQEDIPMEKFGDVRLFNGDVTRLYEDWTTPTTIVSDGAYGTGSFPGEPSTPYDIADWYEPHVKAWSERSTPETTLWFWNTEIGWAEVHPILRRHGWRYRGANIWDKGMSHIAGNSNTQRLRKFPQVTEVCVQYVREAEFETRGGEVLDMQEWVINEWERAGLTREEANDACNVKDAASRKYLTRGDAWYYPPPDKMEELVKYANEHGNPDGRPYFAIDGTPVTAETWEKQRAKFDCPTGVTNVWEHPQVSGADRVTDDEGTTKHPNQKPEELLRRVLQASTDEGDVVWEPFGGLCTAAVVGRELGRTVYAAEMVDEYYQTAVKRVRDTERRSETGQRSLDSYRSGNSDD